MFKRHKSKHKRFRARFTMASRKCASKMRKKYLNRTTATNSTNPPGHKK